MTRSPGFERAGARVVEAQELLAADDADDRARQRELLERAALVVGDGALGDVEPLSDGDEVLERRP